MSKGRTVNSTVTVRVAKRYQCVIYCDAVGERRGVAQLWESGRD
jgi:hypothetical protein